MFTEEQFSALDKAMSLMAEMRFQPPPTEDMVKEGKVHSFGIKHFQRGFLITISAVKMFHLELKNNFGIPNLLVYYLSQDELERKFSEIRGLGGGWNLHPSALEYHQRLFQSVLLQLLEDETFDILALQERLKAKRTENDVELSISMDELPQANYSYLESEGIGEISSKVTSLFQNLGTDIDLSTDVKQMYNIFNVVTLQDGILKQRNLLQGM